MKTRTPAALAAAMMLWLGAGCAVPLSDRPGDPGATVNLSRLENELGGEDPIEGANRVMFAVTDFCMEYIADPLGRIYCTILPRPVIDAIDNVCVNLEYPGRAVSCLLSAEWRGAGDETVRFLANSTIGLAGIFDVAGPWWGFYNTGSDFGQAFAAWGIAPGCTLTLPFSRALNVRDTVSLLFDVAFDGKTYIPFAGYATALNRMVVAHRAYISAVEGSNDRYKDFRQLMLISRELQLRKYAYHARNASRAAAKQPKAALREELPPEPPPEQITGEWLPLAGFQGETPQQQTLRLLRFRPRQDDDFWFYPLSFFNRDFVRSGKVRKLALHPGREKARYCFWKQPEPKNAAPRQEKLALVLPGIGGTWNSATCLALCELFFRAGYDVAAFDSAFSWTFMLSSSGHIRMPGFLPEDAAAVKIMLAATLNDLRRRGDIKSPRTILTGYSMGAMHALKIVDSDRRQKMLKIDRVVAINPPVDLRYALEQADFFTRIGGEWSPRQAVERIVDLSGQMLLSQAMIMPPLGSPEAPDAEAYRFNAAPDTATCALGIYLKSSLRDVLMAAHRERPLPGINEPFRTLNRNRLYLEIDAISFRRYAEELLPREYPGATKEELFAGSSLRPLEESLRSDPRVRVLHSWNDPLLSPQDARYLDATLGKRICWTSGGGHLGALCADAVQRRIIELAEENSDAPEEKSAPALNGKPDGGADTL